MEQKLGPLNSEPLTPARENSCKYAVQSVQRAFELLRAPRYQGEILHLRDMVERTKLNKTTAFRLLQTLQSVGAVESPGADQYRVLVSMKQPARFRIGYAGKNQDSSFARDIAESLGRAAAESGIDLIQLDNRSSAAIALRNADRLVRERVDVAIEFQMYQRIAWEISSKFLDAGIPLVAVEIPHPGAVYFGGNNFEAGRLCGKALANRAQHVWSGDVDGILLLAWPVAGPLPHSALTGVMKGIREILPGIDEQRITHLNGKGDFGESLDAVRKHLRRGRFKRFIVAAINDHSALGALRAFEESGRANDCLVGGQNADLPARMELRRPGTRFTATVGFFPEKYGDGLVRLALEIIHKRHVAPSVFVKHVLITPQNVDAHYPNDTLLTQMTQDQMLMSSM
ncbi:MAG TPA: substrate-binding domain-containing protein [Bryobacteraceae bacterium]|nr:substrate-binding domain-containing protein [Bryobacteraceae bacterium]HPT27282.1 substrate-binding domain-containing protein [Bryobacteraceae bacterium]